MKKIKIYVVALTLISVGLSSCLKEFNPKSYAPPLVINGYTSSSQVAKSSLVGYWAFNGSLVDSVSGTAGTNTLTTFAKGEVGLGLQGALNGYVLNAPAASIQGLQSYTISFWINTPPPSTGIITPFALANTAGFWGNLELFFENGSSNANGVVKLHIQQGNHDAFFVTTNLLNLFDRWINVTVSYDAASAMNTLYINGSKVNSATLGGLAGPLVFPNVGNLVFGCNQFNTNPSQTSATGSQPWASYLTGQMDEFRIYNKALTDIEVSSIVSLQGRGK